MIRKTVQETINLVLAWVPENVPNYGIGRPEDVFEGAGDARLEDWEAMCSERDQLLEILGSRRAAEVERDAAVNRAEQLEESYKIALESLQAQLDAAVKRADEAEKERERWLSDPVIAGRVEVMRLADERDRREAAADPSPPTSVVAKLIAELSELREKEATTQRLTDAERSVVDAAMDHDEAPTPSALRALWNACAALRELSDREGAAKAK